MEKFSILIVDDDTVIKENLVNYLTKFHKAEYELTVDSSESAEEALELMLTRSYNLVIADINMPGESGFDLSEKIKQLYSNTKIAMITAYKVEDYLKLAREKGVSNIIVKTAPFNFDELSTVINGLLLPDKYLWGLENYLIKNTKLNYCTVDSYDSISKVQATLRECMYSLNISNIELLSIAILEAITNAIYHAPHKNSGQKKYDRGEIIDYLDKEDIIDISYGWDEEKLGISVKDKAGKLNKDDVLYWLDRNVTSSNVLDTSGRGIYLMHCIVDRLIINIKPDVQTELIFLIYLKEAYSGHKPIYINHV